MAGEGKIKGMASAVSSDEGEGDGGDMVYDEVDRWEQEKDAAVATTVMKGRKKPAKGGKQEVLAMSGTDSDSDDEGGAGVEQEDEGWGSKKRHFYGGNTGEEQESEQEDSELEEDRAEEVEAARMQDRQLAAMEEEDFLDTFVLPQEKKQEKQEAPAPLTLTRDISQLSRKEQQTVFRQQAPEFQGVVQDFQLRMGEAEKLARFVLPTSTPSSYFIFYLLT